MLIVCGIHSVLYNSTSTARQQLTPYVTTRLVRCSTAVRSAGVHNPCFHNTMPSVDNVCKSSPGPKFEHTRSTVASQFKSHFHGSRLAAMASKKSDHCWGCRCCLDPLCRQNFMRPVTGACVKPLKPNLHPPAYLQQHLLPVAHGRCRAADRRWRCLCCLPLLCHHITANRVSFDTRCSP
jgi:hypothetical protein